MCHAARNARSNRRSLVVAHAHLLQLRKLLVAALLQRRQQRPLLRRLGLQLGRRRQLALQLALGVLQASKWCTFKALQKMQASTNRAVLKPRVSHNYTATRALANILQVNEYFDAPRDIKRLQARLYLALQRAQLLLRVRSCRCCRRVGPLCGNGHRLLLFSEGLDFGSVSRLRLLQLGLQGLDLRGMQPWMERFSATTRDDAMPVHVA